MINKLLTAGFAEAISQLVEEGMSPPLYFTAIGSGGDMMYGQFQKNNDGTWRSEPLAEYSATGTLEFPVNVMVVDCRGKAVGIAFPGPDTPGGGWTTH
jgi:hypothetical protein